MGYFNLSEPTLRCKQTALDVQDLRGLWRIHWQIGNVQIFSALYTRIDLVFITWGLISILVFLTAQFFPVNWSIQAIVGSLLTAIGCYMTVILPWFWVRVEQLRWVIYTWVLLILAGIILTNLGIFIGWVQILPYLCPIWLGLSAIGYFCTALGLRSRAFILAGLIHLLGTTIVVYAEGWRFALTGLIIASTLFFLAELQWDMRLPMDSPVLTPEQQQFNQKQRHLRSSTFLAK